MILASVFALVVAGATPPVNESFDAAVTRVGNVDWGTAKSRIGCDHYLEEAEVLIQLYGPDMTEFLSSRIAGKYQPSTRLSLMTLVALIGDKKAEVILAEHYRNNFDDVVILTYAPAQFALKMADQALIQIDRKPESLVFASLLYRFFGDAQSIRTLETNLENLPSRNKNYQIGNVKLNIDALRQRLACPPEESVAWNYQDLLIWRGVNTRSPLSNKITKHEIWEHIQYPVRILSAQTRFTPAYLKDRLSTSKIGYSEKLIVASIAGIQGETFSIPELKRFLEKDQNHQVVAREALLSIGTREALAPIERLITPPKCPSEGLRAHKEMQILDFHASFVLSLCWRLATHGDRETLRLFESLMNDSAYPAEQRAAFAKARETLKSRLESNKSSTKIESQPDSSF